MEQEALIALKEWALAPAVLALLVMPALGPAWIFGRRNGLALPWIVGLGFAWGVAWCSVLAMAAFYLGGPLDVVVWGFAAGIPVSIGLIVRDVRAHGWLRRGEFGAAGLLCALAAAITAAVQGPWWFGTSDNYFHLAASRSLLATGRPIVTDPFYGLDSKIPDSTAGMWNTVQAVVSRLVDTDVATVYPALTTFAAFVVALAFWVLAREISRSDRAATVATLAYFVAAWYTDLRAFGFPNKVSIALAFTAIALVVRIVEDPRARWVLAAGLTGLATLAVHLASGQLELLCGGAILVTVLAFSLFTGTAEERRATRRAALLASAGLALMVVPSLPTLYHRVVALAGSPVLGEDSFIWAGDQLRTGPLGWRYIVPGGFDFGGAWLFWGTAVAAVFAFAYARRTGSRRAMAAFALMITAHVISTFPLISTPVLMVSSYMMARMLELLRFAPYIAIAFVLGQLEPFAARRTGAGLGSLLLIIALVTSWPGVVSTYVQGEGEARRGAIWSIPEARARDMRQVYGFSEIFEMRRLVGDTYPTVASDPDSAYHLMGLVSVAVVPGLPTHTPVFIGAEEAQRRIDDMEELFYPKTTRHRRAEILVHYDVDYVFHRLLISGFENRDQLLADDDLFEVLVRNDEIMFMRVDKELAKRIAAGEAGDPPPGTEAPDAVGGERP